MLLKTEITWFVIVSFTICYCSSYFDTTQKEHCFCKLKGKINDCVCSVDTVDYYNNVKIFPRIKSLLENDYFRFYKVNLKRDCPFWVDNSRCAMKFCRVEPCDDNTIPIGIKGTNENRHSLCESPQDKYMNGDILYSSDYNDELSYLNTTISAANYKEFELWKEHDYAQDNFCVEQDDNGDATYVDLLLNPERYTGYKGESAHKIWKSIYEENCFKPRHDIVSYLQSTKFLNGMCLEKRVFYRVISGLHTSINIHLCANYLLSEIQQNLKFVSPNGQWGPNLQEFKQRFDPISTNGESQHWFQNLYFLYLLELRALEKATPYLQYEEFYSGNGTNDEDVRLMVKNLLQVVGEFPHHFNEHIMFNGGGLHAQRLKEEFRQHFRNISTIMDCVGCDKCKLWGKLQTQGLGTALKILFSGKYDGIVSKRMYLNIARNKFHLQRDEIVSLFNAFGRLSTSIYHLEQFRNMLS